ncbi:MAG: ankyrin repeat domain-containing protein [Prevotellaceae bacterium]|jgi:hypothetical protein|nr:ankyrin repeat domain-containing protein [Prevotellaceae bacterium]
MGIAVFKRVWIVWIFALSSCGARTSSSGDKTSELEFELYAKLIEAIQTDDSSTFDKLITQLSDINLLIPLDEDEEYSLLGYACKYKRCLMAEKIIQQNADIDIGHSDGYTIQDALYVAVMSEDVCLVKLLLNNGADPNRFNSEYGLTVLSICCANGFYDIAKLLIESGANVDGVGDTGFEYIVYPLMLAVGNDNMEMVKMLMENNCTINIKDKQDETPFTVARNREDIEMLALLQEYADQKVFNDKVVYLKFGEDLGNGWWEVLLCEVDFYDAMAGYKLYDQKFGTSYKDAPERVTVINNNDEWFSRYVCLETDFFLWIEDPADPSRMIRKELYDFAIIQNIIKKNRDEGLILAEVFQHNGIISCVMEIYIDMKN